MGGARKTRNSPRGRQRLLSGGRERVLVVVFIPSVRCYQTAADLQADSRLAALGVFWWKGP